MGLLISKIESQFGFSILFPSPYPYTHGMKLQREVDSETEVVGYRQLQALHQALLLHSKVPEKHQRIVEIGGGLGHTAFYAQLLGYTDYTIVDLPITEVWHRHIT